MEFTIRIAFEDDIKYSNEITYLYKLSAEERGIGIALRQPAYIEKKIKAEHAIIAMHDDELAGFCYVETFSSGEYVSNSGLIVKAKYRGQGLAKKIKKSAVQIARNKFPSAKLFGITTSDVVLRINSELGYKPVTFNKLTTDSEFWNGCSSCRNYDILQRNEKKMCLCTAMLAPSKIEKKIAKEAKKAKKKSIKQAVKKAFKEAKKNKIHE